MDELGLAFQALSDMVLGLDTMEVGEDEAPCLEDLYMTVAGKLFLKRARCLVQSTLTKKPGCSKAQVYMSCINWAP